LVAKMAVGGLRRPRTPAACMALLQPGRAHRVLISLLVSDDGP
jgi:hypothetical protein